MSLTGIAQTNLAMIQNGGYNAPSGEWVPLRQLVDAAVSGTALYRPAELDHLLDTHRPAAFGGSTRIELTTESTGEAARRLVEKEGETNVVALNFASARNPGGGYIRGAKAQEEDLARCSALYNCLITQPDYYAENRANPSMLYTEHLIYSPNVPFFRDDSYELLSKPFVVSMITSPAPNAGEAIVRGERAGILPTLVGRARRVLAVAAERKHRVLVLGAWGCGVFRNDPREVARVFGNALSSAEFAGVFSRVVFGIWERNKDRPSLRAFSEELGVVPQPIPA
ncbi:MAG: TIGR02452 family protein [Polyangiaceae bacterium]|nr:TIGR02452 family protein [Polyangiaceae bacterium]